MKKGLSILRAQRTTHVNPIFRHTQPCHPSVTVPCVRAPEPLVTISTGHYPTLDARCPSHQGLTPKVIKGFASRPNSDHGHERKPNQHEQPARPHALDLLGETLVVQFVAGEEQKRSAREPGVGGSAVGVAEWGRGERGASEFGACVCVCRCEGRSDRHVMCACDVCM